MSEKQVYLIESECGRIKLGSSFDPLARLAAFYVNSPRPLRLIARWPGSQSDEMQTHKRFAAYRRHNEWFVLEGEFAAFVESRRGLGVEGIPEWDTLLWLNRRERARTKRAAAQRAIRSDPVWQAEQASNRAWRKHLKTIETNMARSLSYQERSLIHAAWLSLPGQDPLAEPQTEAAA